NQRRLETCRTFDAADRAFNRGDFAFAGGVIDRLEVNHLDQRRKDRLKEIMMTPQMQPGPRGVQQASAGDALPPQVGKLDGAGHARVTDLPPTPAQVARADVGHAPASDAAPDGVLATTAAMRNIKFQQLRKEGLDLQHEASEKFRSGQTDAALDLLQG